MLYASDDFGFVVFLGLEMVWPKLHSTDEHYHALPAGSISVLEISKRRKLNLRDSTILP